MKYRVDLDFIGTGNASKKYGGKLKAWSFMDVDAQVWFNNFRNQILSSINKEFLPVYRMADGEYRFLIGRKYNWHRKPLWKELLAVSAEKLRIKNPDKWKTSWGETYSPKETRELRSKLVSQIQQIATSGYLGCFINDNGLKRYIEYNKSIALFFKKKNIVFDEKNYIPFHFVVGLLVNKGWQDFYINRNILVVSGTDTEKEKNIKSNILRLGAKSVQFLRISGTASMKEKLNLSQIQIQPDICFVAAGIGSANILLQLRPLNTVALDIGGYINCFIDTDKSQHGGVFKYVGK